MPFQRVLSTQPEDIPDTNDPVAELATKIKGVLSKLDLLVIKRYPRTTGKPKPVGMPIESRFDSVVEDEDTYVRELATAALQTASEDAGEKKAKFQFVAYAEATGGGARGVLFEHDQVLHPDDERPTTKQAEEVGILRVAKDHMKDVCVEHIKLLAKTNDLVQMAVNLVGKSIDSNGALASSQVEILRMKYDHDVKGAQLLVQQTTSQSRHRMYVELIKTVTPFGERLVDVFAGKPRDEDAPTAEEIDKIFGKLAPDLRDHALAVIRAEKGEKRDALALKFRDAWEAVGSSVQGDVVKLAHKDLGEARANRVTMWIAALFNGLPK